MSDWDAYRQAAEQETDEETRIVLMLKRADFRQQQIEEVLRIIGDFPLMVPGLSRINDATTLLNYIRARIPEEAWNDLNKHVRPTPKDIFLTTAEKFRIEGEVRGQAELLKKQLTLKFGPLSDDTLDRLYLGTADELGTWGTRILTADTIDDVLAETTDQD